MSVAIRFRFRAECRSDGCRWHFEDNSSAVVDGATRLHLFESEEATGDPHEVERFMKMRGLYPEGLDHAPGRGARRNRL